MTSLGDLLHFGQLFKAFGNNYFAQIVHILGNFCKGVKIFNFSGEILSGQGQTALESENTIKAKDLTNKHIST